MKRGTLGFTLIEILVALALTATVTLILYLSFDSITASSKTLEEYSSKMRERTLFMDLFEKDVTGAFYTTTAPFSRFILSEKDLAGETVSELSLTSFNVSFTGVVSFATDIIRVHYTPKLSNDGKSIHVVRTISFNPHVPSFEKEVEGVVLTGVEKLSIHALSGEESRGTWRSDETMRLPEKLEVLVEFTDGFSLKRELPLPLKGSVQNYINSGKRSEQQ